MLGGNLAVVGGSRDQGRGHLLEGRVEGLVIEKDPVVVVAAVESVLDLSDRSCNLPYIRVSRKGHKGRVHARPWGNTLQVLPLFCAGCQDQRGLAEVLVVGLCWSGTGLFACGVSGLFEIDRVERYALVCRVGDEVEDS